MGTIIGSVFYNLRVDTSSFYSRGALIFFATMINATSSAFEVCLIIQMAQASLNPFSYLGADFMGTKTNCGKANSLRILSPIRRSGGIHDMRFTEQATHVHVFQPNILLHG